MIREIDRSPLLALLRCPRTKQPLVLTGTQLICRESGFEGQLIDGVAAMMPTTHQSFFDDKFEVMREGHKAEGEHKFCYEQQMALFEFFLRPGMVVLDVGCGPSLPYHKPTGVSVVGLEPSFQSIRANTQCDLRIFGSAFEIPLADQSVDAVVCVYSIHHMVGRTIADTRSNVQRAFREFGRVLKPGGKLFVFEMTPISVFAVLQRAAWNLVRRLVPNKLDMFFWTATEMTSMAQQTLGPGAQLEKVFFGTSAFTTFPPAFSLPWLRVPRLIYPLDAKLYKWHMPHPQG